MFSIVIPLHNKEFEIETTLKSICLNKEFINEIIIINNNSTDNGLYVVKKFIQHTKDSNIKFIVKDENKAGVTHAREAGIKLANSKWVALCDADDIWEKNHLKLLNSMITPNCDIVSSAYRIEDKKCRNISKGIIFIKDSKSFFKLYFFNRSLICSSSFAIRKDYYLSNPYNHNLKIGEDLEFLFRVASKSRIKFQTNNPTVVIRKNIQSMRSEISSQNIENYEMSLHHLTKIETIGFWEKMVIDRRKLILLMDLKKFHLLFSAPIVLFLELLRKLILHVSERS